MTGLEGTGSPWLDPEWLAEATEWIERELRRAGLARDGEMEQPHVYWWSTALRVPTTDGVLWFKAAQPDGAFEARLLPLLAAIRPAEIVELVATDGDRGWMLTRDAGSRLREIEEGPALAGWEELLPRYAELQLQLAQRRAELLALGVADHRLAVLPEQLRSALADPEATLLEQSGGLTSAQQAALLTELPHFADLCQRLAALDIPETLQHDDLHDGNVFVRDGTHVFFDWGDACISHPFHTLVVTLRALAYRYELAPGGSELTRLRDAYLEPWTSIASRHEVTEAADIARRTGVIQRAVAWHRVAAAMPAPVRPDYIDAVPYGLRLFLLDGPFGTWDDGSL